MGNLRMAVAIVRNSNIIMSVITSQLNEEQLFPLLFDCMTLLLHDHWNLLVPASLTRHAVKKERLLTKITVLRQVGEHKIITDIPAML